MVVKIPIDSTTQSVQVSPYLIRDGLKATNVSCTQLDCGNWFGGIILEHADHVVGVNEGVINGNCIHFAKF